MAKFKALTPIDHDGKRYEIGDMVDMKDDKQAAPLLALGAIEAPKAEKKPEEAPVT